MGPGMIDGVVLWAAVDFGYLEPEEGGVLDAPYT